MSNYLEYQLQNGYIDNWLVAGPQAIPVTELERFEEEDYKSQIAQHYYDADSGITGLPVERDTFTAGDTTLTWSYVRCRDDHLVDLTAFYRTCHYLRTWAYAQVLRPTSQEVTFVLTTNGPADLWLNGQRIHRQEHFHHQIPHSVPFQATLQEGWNEILVRFEEVAVRECPYAMALRIGGWGIGDGGWGTHERSLQLLTPIPSSPIPVRLPTHTEAVAHRQALEQIFEAAYLDRDVYVHDDHVTVRWPDDLPERRSLAVRLQTPSGRIYAEALLPRTGRGHPLGAAASSAHSNSEHAQRAPAQSSELAAAGLAKGFQLPDGEYRVVLMPRPEEYHQGNLRIRREIGLWVLKNAYSQRHYGTYDERRREALADAAQRAGSVFTEIAKMELGQWTRVNVPVIQETIAGINRRQDCSDFYMVGLIGMLYRYGDDASFPEELKRPLEACILDFKYWMDEPGSDAMCYWSENHQILFHTCEILAGQRYPDRTFTNVGELGAWHREKGERMALAWLHKRGSGGFREWDSNCYFEEDLLALAHLADLAESTQVREMATVIMDKLFFTIALNSYRGAFGSTHGRTYTPLIKGARLEATAGITRLMWGMGVYNHHILGTVSLACAEGYELPAIVRQIATDLPEEMWSRERHAGELEEWCDRATGAWEVNKVTYKTPDYMLCSAQDYQPGEKGYQQHIWQATLGPDAVVFVTHPPCVSEEGSHRPNFWHGNVILPRVAQWRDTLIAIHNLPEDDWMGFTHAYFPVYAFDEHLLRDGWAFARKGDGYLALTAAAGLTLMTHGDNAYRELRSYGQHNVWICQMGRRALDGDFGDFQARVIGGRESAERRAQSAEQDIRSPLSASSAPDLSVRYTTPRGETLDFGYTGPLLVDGREEPITGFKHYENPYCIADLPASQMEIRFGLDALRLDFGRMKDEG